MSNIFPGFTDGDKDEMVRCFIRYKVNTRN